MVEGGLPGQTGAIFHFRPKGRFPGSAPAVLTALPACEVELEKRPERVLEAENRPPWIVLP